MTIFNSGMSSTIDFEAAAKQLSSYFFSSFGFMIGILLN